MNSFVLRTGYDSAALCRPNQHLAPATEPTTDRSRLRAWLRARRGSEDPRSTPK